MFQTPERRPKNKFADLTGEPSFLKSAGRRFQTDAVPTPLHFKERDIIRGGAASTRSARG